MARKKWAEKPTPAEQARARAVLRDFADWAAWTEDRWEISDNYDDIDWLRDELSATRARAEELAADLTMATSMLFQTMEQLNRVTDECRCQRRELRAKARGGTRKISLSEDI